jgi:hypothetical protein
MTASTVMEALTAELLGDVGLLHDEIKKLPGALDDISQAATVKFQEQSDLMLEMTKKHQNLINNLVGQAEVNIRASAKNLETHIQAAALSAGDAAKLDVRQSVAETIKILINEILLPVMLKASTDSEDSLKKLKDVSSTIESRMTIAAENAINKVNEATEKMQSERLWTIVYCAASSFVGSGLIIAFFKMTHFIKLS